MFCTAGDTSAGLTLGVFVVGEGTLSSSGITFVAAGGMVGDTLWLFVGKTVPSYVRQTRIKKIENKINWDTKNFTELIWFSYLKYLTW